MHFESHTELCLDRFTVLLSDISAIFVSIPTEIKMAAPLLDGD